MALPLRLSAIVRLSKGVCTPNHRCLSLSFVRSGTIVPFKLSDIGEGIREVTVKEWFVSPGDKVAQFDQICEVQSDKASVTITSRYDGHVKTLHYKIDDTALVGNPLVDIELDDDVPSVTSDMKNETQDKLTTTINCKKSSDVIYRDQVEKKDEQTRKFLTTPAVRRIAWENKINLKDVVATGKAGRILKEDMLSHLEQKSVTNVKKSVDVDATVAGVSKFAGGVGKTVPLRAYEKHMWKSMTRSLSIPHFVYSDECDVTKLVQFRNEVKNFLNEKGISLTFMPFFIKAVSKALSEFPRLNAWVDESSQTLQVFEEHNISLAMDTPEGLVVPNIKNVQNLSIIEIARELNRLQELGRKSSISLKDITGGTFSLSNIGVIGGTYTKPVILPPQIVIGAIGKIQKLPRYDVNLTVIPADIISISWAADHRVVDGVTMAKFSNRWKYFVEHPLHLHL